MKKYLLFLPLVALIYLGSIASVPSSFLLTDTPTPIPTSTINVPNLFPTVDAPLSGCPTGLPGGYGVVTPSGSWSLMCSQCLPTPTLWGDSYDFEESPYSTAQTICTTPGAGTPSTCENVYPATFTPEPTGTPFGMASVTPIVTGSAPTVTSTPAYTGEFTYGSGFFSFGGIANVGSSSVSCVPNYVADTYDILCHGSFSGTANSGSALSYGVVLNAIDIPLTYYWDIDFVNPANQTHRCTVAGVEVPCNSSHTVTGSGDFTLRLQTYRTGGGTGLPVTGSFIFRVSSAPLVPPAPSPTPTAVYGGSAYCSNIVAEGMPLALDLQFWGKSTTIPLTCIDMPDIDTGEIYDFITESWLLSWMTGGVLDDFFQNNRLFVEGKTLCFQVYDFLDVSLFTVQLNWAYFLDIIVGGFIARHLMSK